MRKISISLIIFSSFVFHNVSAASENGHADSLDEIRSLPAPKRVMHERNCYKKCWFTGLGLGVAWVSNMTIPNGNGFSPPANVDQYVPNSSLLSSPVFSLDGGYRLLTAYKFPYAFSVGLRYRYVSLNSLEGDVIEESNSSLFNNYTYKVSFSSNVVTAIGKMDLVRWGNFAPYVVGGVGVARNNAENYSETAKPGVTPRVSPAFDSRSSTDFAYEAGVGVDYYVKKAIILSTSYDYLNLGTLKTGNGTQNWSQTSLEVGSASVNTVMFRATYIFG